MMVGSVESLRLRLAAGLMPGEKRVIRCERFGHVPDKLSSSMGEHANLGASFGTVERVGDDKPRVFVKTDDHGFPIKLTRAEEKNRTYGPAEQA